MSNQSRAEFPPLPGEWRWAARLLVAVSGVAACVAAAAPGALGFTTQVTPGLIAKQAQQFGHAAQQRIASWVDFARGKKGARRVGGPPDMTGAELDALRSVNAFFNRIPFRSDSQHWGVEDYWATPAELTSGNAGDCEDYSIAKYFLLKELGVPVERLRITYVKAVRIDQAHMVLAYYASPGADPLILDNLEQGVRTASERTDLVPVYSFNDDDIVIVRDARRSSPLQIRAWRGLLQKLESEARL